MQDYIVQSEETLDDILNKYDCNTDRELILKGNDFFTKNIIPGQVIKVPKNTRINEDEFIFYEYVVKEGDNLYDLANKNNIDVNTLAEINGINIYDYLYPNQVLNIPNEGYMLYITKPSDTLQNIIKYFGTSMKTVTDLNQNIYLLPEQLIVIKK